MSRATAKNVWVQADVIDPTTGEEHTTNDFYFTWCRDDGEPLKRMVVPRTYKGERHLIYLCLYRADVVMRDH